MVLKRAAMIISVMAIAAAFAWAQQAPTPQPPLKDPPDPDTVAMVNGEKITRAELVTAMLPEHGPAVLERLVEQKLVDQAIAKQDLQITQADLDRAYNWFKTQNFPNPQAFEEYEQRVGKEYILWRLRPRISYVKLGENLVQVSDDELGEVKASHILARIAGPDDTAAKEKIDKAMAELKDGEDFAAVAKKYSEDPGSAPNGGDLGFFIRGRMVKEFEDAAFGAKPGELVGPIRTQFGYHIIKVTETRPASQLDPATRQERRDQLILNKTSESVRQWLEANKKKADVEKYKLLPDNFLPR
jgi:foldase protein PrsA